MTIVKESDICVNDFVYLVSSSVEADEEMKKSETSRDLNEDDKKETPSKVMSVVEKGLNVFSNMLANEFNVYVALSAVFNEKCSYWYFHRLSGREARAANKQFEDDANDFNDDFSMYEAFSKSQAEGKLTEEGRAKKQAKPAGFKPGIPPGFPSGIPPGFPTGIPPGFPGGIPAGVFVFDQDGYNGNRGNFTNNSIKLSLNHSYATH